MLYKAYGKNMEYWSKQPPILTLSSSFSVLSSSTLSSSLSIIPPFLLSLPVPSVHRHIEFSQEFEHELIISDSCCSCVSVFICMFVYVCGCVCVLWMLTILTGGLSPQSQFHTPSSLPNSTRKHLKTHTQTHTDAHTQFTCVRMQT